MFPAIHRQYSSMKLLGHIPSWLRNKYFLSTAIFVVFITFFDDRDLVANYHHRQQLKELERSAQYYRAEIEKTKNELNQLKNDAATLEKYAREKYYMKRDNEDVFVIKPAKKREE
jgi:cell division protein DivIC